MQETTLVIEWGATAPIADLLVDRHDAHSVRGRQHGLPRNARGEHVDLVIGRRSTQSWNTIDKIV